MILRRGEEEELKMDFWVFVFLFENEEEDVVNIWVFVVLMKKMELKMDGEEDDVDVVNFLFFIFFD